MTSLYMFLATVAGAFIPLQIAINMQLANRVDSNAWSAMASFVGGSLALLAYLFLTRVPWPTMEKAIAFPWWLWTGGLLGAFLVWVGIAVAPSMGATTLIAFLLIGQLIASLLFDQFGWFGLPVHEISSGRMIGVALLMTGAVLIRKF